MERQNAPTRLSLKLNTGFNPSKNADVIRSYSFGNIDPDASDTSLYALANTLSSLSTYALTEVVRVDTANLQPLP